jgi:hypothetical protein
VRKRKRKKVKVKVNLKQRVERKNLKGSVEDAAILQRGQME